MKLLIVVKIGGKILEEGLPQNITIDIKNLILKHNLVFVHGGGIEVTEIAAKLGVQQKFIISPSGFKSRYTDKKTAEIYTMVMAGKLNKEAVVALQRKRVPAVGLSGLDGLLLKAHRKKRLVIIDERGRKVAIDGGYTGTLKEINTKLLNLLLDNKYVPVISPIAIGENFEFLNVDGDRVAAHVAGALKADILVLLTDVEGLIIDDKVIPKISISDAKNLLPKIGPGMITKVHAAVSALDLGTKEAVISSGRIDKPITSAVHYQVGTVIYLE